MSQVHVPSDPAFGIEDFSWQAPTANPGALVDLTYPGPSPPPPSASTTSPCTRRACDANRAVLYPALSLSHGGGGNEVDWSSQGISGRIVDSLIAAGKMQPTVAVITNFNGLAGTALPAYQNDVLNRVIPFIESQFNVSELANERAFVGLSAGGQRANQLICNARPRSSATSLRGAPSATCRRRGTWA